MEGASILPLALRHPLLPPPPRRCNDDGSNLNMLSKTTMCGSQRPYYVGRCIESLPDEVLFDILVCLPADHLYDKARLVCRKWYHIIHSDAFIKTTINQSSTNGLLLLPLLPNRHAHPIYVTATQGRIETSELSYKCRAKILACCNGLVVGFHHDRVNGEFCLHVINPATKQLFLLPSLSIHKNYRLRYRLCGMAYSPASKQYKVILPYISVGHSRGLKILTVGVDKSWRDVPVSHLPATEVWTPFAKSLMMTEGFLHWGIESYVLTMNVETEIFTVSQLPLPRPHYNHRWHYLSAGRYLSLLVGRGQNSWEVWELKLESGEWRKLLPNNIELASVHCDRLVPLGWVKYPQILAFCVWSPRHTCIFYNLDTHEIDSIELPAFFYERSRALAHMKTLAWIC